MSKSNRITATELANLFNLFQKAKRRRVSIGKGLVSAMAEFVQQSLGETQASLEKTLDEIAQEVSKEFNEPVDEVRTKTKEIYDQLASGTPIFDILFDRSH